MSTVTQRIMDDLRGWIQSGSPLPFELTLKELSRHYQVSLTPVRSAVTALAEDGFILKKASGRLSPNPARANGQAAPAKLPHELHQRPWESELIRDIICRSLSGEQEYLREESTAGLYGVGRTILRHVFGQLAGKGLLIHVPRCGWRVRAYDERDMHDYIEIRVSLETTALNLSRKKLVRSDLKRMLEGNRPTRKSGRARLDNDLHRYLIMQSGNHYLSDFFDHQSLYYTTLFDFAAPETHVVRKMASQHCEILEALLNRKWARARKSLENHIRCQEPILHKLLKKMVRKNPDP